MKKWENAEGYPDPTACTAIRKMEEKGMLLHEGDIFSVRRLDGKTAQNLLIKVFDNYSMTLMLKDTPEYIQPENMVEIVSRAVMYADAGRLGYVFNNILDESEYIRTVGASKLDLIKGKIVELILGQDAVQGPTEAHSPEIGTPVVKPSDETACTVVQDSCGDRIDPAKLASNEDAGGIAELVRMDTERQIYKGLSERLLAIIEKGAGAR